MGLMDKLRDIFTEEVEEQIEEPIKKEVIQVEIPAPQQKEEKEEEAIKKEEKPAPIFFDDNDFAGLEPPKKNKQTQKTNPYERIKKPEEKKEEKKIFKPTPIISPVYGVLDKNYHKEDIKTKNNSSRNAYYNHKEFSIDEIRKKAYGTLEDELEITLFGESEKIEVEPEQKKVEPEIDMFDELMDEQEKIEKTQQIDDSDLFNLIDSMYEKEDDNNGNS